MRGRARAVREVELVMGFRSGLKRKRRKHDITLQEAR